MQAQALATPDGALHGGAAAQQVELLEDHANHQKMAGAILTEYALANRKIKDSRHAAEAAQDTA
jgi:citrate synthase